MAGKAKEDQLKNQSPAMRAILKAMRHMQDVNRKATYRGIGADKFIYNCF